MNDVNDWIDAARAAANLPSDNQLAKRIGVARQTISHWRTRRTLPDEPQMVALGRLAGIAPEVALATLHYWIAPFGPLKSAWRHILDNTRRAALPAVLAAGVAGGVAGLPRPGQASLAAAPDLYIMRKRRTGQPAAETAIAA